MSKKSDDIHRVDIHRVEAGEIERMRDVTELLGRAFEDLETYTSKPPSDAYLQDLLGRESFIALAAYVDGELAGGLAAYELKKFEQERSEVYIYDLAVAEEHRRRGVATAMIEETARLAKELGAWIVYVQADLGDEPATALYDKLGVREEVLHFDISVDIPVDIPVKRTAD